MTDAPTDNAAALMDILVCPKSMAPLVRDGDRLVSRDAQTRLAYPVRDGIPIMLADDATELPEDEWRRVVEAAGDLS